MASAAARAARQQPSEPVATTRRSPRISRRVERDASERAASVGEFAVEHPALALPGVLLAPGLGSGYLAVAQVRTDSGRNRRRLGVRRVRGSDIDTCSGRTFPSG
ncbi:hypothetical protein ACFQH2_08250 [Natronoarchaeum sp. GCM10025703]|uniref:hypothetical protein n=1 Tax=Natronoarchaeum sp. GCM10025703 TaxID=3252685 RepID=UPI00360CD09A